MFDANRLRAAMALRGVTGKELAKQLGIDESTFYRKMKTGNFSRDEINNTIEFLEIDDPKPIFFAEKLA